jgi:hypothetical protein
MSFGTPISPRLGAQSHNLRWHYDQYTRSNTSDIVLLVILLFIVIATAWKTAKPKDAPHGSKPFWRTYRTCSSIMRCTQAPCGAGRQCCPQPSAQVCNRFVGGPLPCLSDRISTSQLSVVCYVRLQLLLRAAVPCNTLPQAPRGATNPHAPCTAALHN